MDESPALRHSTLLRSRRVTLNLASGSWRRLRGVGRAAARLASRTTLFQRFMLVSLVILVVGAYIIGSYVAGEIKARVIQRTSALTALYVDSFISPHLQELEHEHEPSSEHFTQLDELLTTTSLGEEIVSFKIWHHDGEIAYASERALIGQRFPIAGDLGKALEGEIQTNISSLDESENVYEARTWDRLLETYAPIHAQETGEIIGVSEFYQDPSDLESEVSSSQRKGWLIVGGATGVMYLLLVGMVRGASTTISRQHRRLEQLAQGNAELARRVRQAAAGKSETDERLMMRIAQDLHDGPAQDVSLALLRLEALGQVAENPGAQEDIHLMESALRGALKEIRDIAGGLRLPEVEQLPLEHIVRTAIAEHKAKTGDQVEVTVGATLPAVTLPVKIAAYRVTQEALTNAHVHGGGGTKEVSVRFLNGALALEIRDHGPGGAVTGADSEGESGGAGARLGIRGMRERVEMLGGTLEVTSRGGEGTIVLATIPISVGDA